MNTSRDRSRVENIKRLKHFSKGKHSIYTKDGYTNIKRKSDGESIFFGCLSDGLMIPMLAIIEDNKD